MALMISCPNPSCRKQATVDSALRGERTICPYCLRAIPIPTGLSSTRGLQGLGQRLGRQKRVDKGPDQVGRFVIQKTLGSGGFATVYKAYDPVLDRVVAVKVPHRGMLGSKSVVEQFRREARATAKLRHSHMVPFLEAVVDGEELFLVSAYIEGTTLSDVLDTFGPLAPRRAARIVADVAYALQHAHEQGILHRDVKPSNILVDRRDHAFLMDFGLARRVQTEVRKGRSSTIVGTPGYVAPEIASDSGASASPTVDQYGLGVTLYELLTGEKPFEGPAHVMLAQAIASEPPSLRSKNPKIPERLEAICLKAIARDPASRHLDCFDLAEALESYLSPTRPVTMRIPTIRSRIAWETMDGVPIVAEPSSHGCLPHTPATPRSPYWTWAGLGALLALGVTIGGFLLPGPPTRPMPRRPAPTPPAHHAPAPDPADGAGNPR